jgi:O-antigen/teichoic acid export membrane protein
MKSMAATVTEEASEARTSKRVFVKNAVSMSFAQYVSYGISMLMGFVNAYVLGPTQLGVIKTINVISGYAGYSDFGLMKGMFLELPKASGRGDEAARQRIQNTVFTGSLFTTPLTILILWGLYAAGVNFKGALTLPIMVLLSGLVVLDKGVQFYDFYAKASGAFDVVARRDLLVSALTLIIGVPFVLWWGVPGILYYFMVVYLCQVIFMQRKLHLRFKLMWDWVQVKALVRTGGMLMLNAFVGNIYWTVDLTLVALLLTTRDTGIYGFALGALNFSEIVPGVIHKMIFQRMAVTRGKVGASNSSDFRGYMENPWAIYLLTTAISAGSVFFIYSVGIELLLPRYRDSLSILPIMIFGYMFFATRTFTGSFLAVSDQLGLLGLVQLTGLVVNVTLDLSLIPRFGTVGAAIGSTVSYILFGGVMCYVALTQIYDNRWGPFTIFARLAFCFVVSALAMTWIGYHGLSLFSGLQPSFLQLGIGIAVGIFQCVLYIIGCVLIFVLVFWRQGLAAELKHITQDITHAFLTQSTRPSLLAVPSPKQ